MANAQIRVSFLDNGRGGHYLIHAGFKYSVRNQYKERTYWRCVNRECSSLLTTENNIPVAFKNDHVHPSNPIGNIADALINDVRKRCSDEIGAIPTIYDEELARLLDREFDDESRQVIEAIPTFDSCKSSLYRSRSKTLPKLPKVPADIQLDGEWTETTTGEKFLLTDSTDDGQRMLIFSTDSNLEHLCNSTFMLGDGTFYSIPGLFAQLYSLHGEVNGVVFPFVYALLPNKSQNTYLRFMRSVNEAVHQRNLVLSPDIILTDFETAAQNAIRTVFPDSTLKGCFFHYSQCIWRKTQNCGLAIRYREEDNIRHLVRRAAVLPLVPVGDVEDVWFYALEQNDDNSAEVTRFTDYVTETWVEGKPLRDWNHFDTTGPRTTNHVEGWHSKINRLCNHSHPNIFASVKLLKSVQAVNEAKIIQLLAGGSQRPRKRKYRELEVRLQRLKERLTSDEISVYEYADSAKHIVKLGR